jgi:hypothetical protein
MFQFMAKPCLILQKFLATDIVEADGVADNDRRIIASQFPGCYPGNN